MSIIQRILFWGAGAVALTALGAGSAQAQDEVLDLGTANSFEWKLKQVPKDDKSALDQFKVGTYVPDDTWIDQEVPGNAALADPEDDASFYYRLEFTVPATFPKNRAVILHGFNVDDRDETYLNGTQIGTGTTSGVERVYTIPDGLLDYSGKNVILIFGTEDAGDQGITITGALAAPLLETIGDGEGWLKVEALDASDRPAANVPFTITEDVEGVPTPVDYTTDATGTFWRRDLEPGTVPIQVTQYPWTGNLTPNGALPQTITAGQLTTLTLHQQPFIYQVLRTTTPIVIDGTKEAVWDKAVTMEINDKRQVVEGSTAELWTGLEDVSCRARWMYDDTYIYLFAEVTDDARNNIQVDQEDATSWGNSWQGDGFETYIQLDPYTASRTTYATDKNYQWTLGVNAEDKVSWKIFRATATPNDTTPFSDPLTIPSPEGNAKVVSTTNPKGYILEARFKWSDLPQANASLIPPKTGTGGAIGLAVNDSDDEGALRQSQIMWNAKNDLWNNPVNFVRAVWGDTELLNLAPPAVPIHVVANSSGSTVTLTWDAVPNASGYKIRRSTKVTGPFTTFIKNTGNVPLTVTTFSDTNLTVGNTYYYAVVATNLVGDSTNSTITPVTVGGGGGACKGDASGDKKVDVNDAVAILRHSTGLTLLTGPARINADINGDGSTDAGVNVEDAVKVLQFIVGIPNTGITTGTCP